MKVVGFYSVVYKIYIKWNFKIWSIEIFKFFNFLLFVYLKYL